MDLNLFKKDWERIPQNFRYLIFSGAILLIIVWFLDHWGKEPYNLFGFDYRWLFFHIGIWLIVAGLSFIAVRQFWILSNTFILRKKYPLDLIGNKLYIISFSGRWDLFDTRDKTRHWIENPQTVRDLGFSGQEIYVTSQLSDPVTTPSGKVIDPKNFTPSQSIKTQE